MYVPLPYQGYYQPVMYRPYVSPFIGGGGGRGRVPARVIYPRQVPVGGSSTKSSSPAKSSGSDNERVASPDITRNTESPQGQGSNKKGHSSRSRAMVYVPRIPAPYPPMYYPYQPYPGYYYLPEDPRVAQAHARYPYIAQGIPPQVYPHPYPAGPYIGSPIRPSQVSPENTPSPGERSPNSQRSHSLSPGPQRPPRSQSPALSPNSTAAAAAAVMAGAGAHFQLLPNVKHIPPHLYAKPGSSGSNSRSSTPLGGRDSPATERAGEEVRASLEHDYLKSVSPKLDLQERRASAQSPLARVISQRQGYIRDELEAMTSHGAQRTQYQTVMGTSRINSATMQNGAGGMEKGRSNKKPSRLDLHSATGFSRQFSEDITTPTEITNLVKMIDDVDDMDMETKTLTHQSFAAQKNTSGRLYLNIPPQQELVMGGSASSSPPSGSPTLGDQKPTYAGVLRRRLPSAQGDIDPSLLEPQTPHTPLGFTTPGTEIDTDPLGILRNLNINSSAENQRTYKYFS